MMQTMYQYVVVKRELSVKAHLPIYWSSYSPTKRKNEEEGPGRGLCLKCQYDIIHHKPLQYSPEQQVSPRRQYHHMSADEGREEAKKRLYRVCSFPSKSQVFKLLQHPPLNICMSLSFCAGILLKWQ